jgi:hypothetical protein
MKCVDCGTEQEGNLVHSGVDAFVLGVIELVQKICYNCANARRRRESQE